MYCADGKLHQSTLKEIGKSLSHYAYACANPRQDKPSFLLGRVAHALCLQKIQPTVYSGKERKGNAWEKFQADNSGVDIITSKELQNILGMEKAFWSNYDVCKLMERCSEREVAVEWMRNGHPCAGRVDAMGNGALIELKTTYNAHPSKFLWDAQKMSYHAQLAWYDVACGVVPCGPDTAWSDQYIIAVETKAPYPVVVYALDNLRIDQGNALIEDWLKRLDAGIASGEWGGYTKGIQIWDGQIALPSDEEGSEDD
jgi:hypothetical protein